jgi:thiamine-phosphate pyrophosphorylase
MITDRIRLGSSGDTALVDLIAAAARAGVHLIQVRERDLEGGPLTRLVEACVDAVRPTAARIIVNDRLDVALAAGAHGVHLRHDSIAAQQVRRIAPPGFLVGRSVHSRDEVAHAAEDGGLDYLIFGPVFATRSKPGVVAAGLVQLADAAAASPIPVLGVGGISPERSGDVVRAGAAGIAAIGLFMDQPCEAVFDIVRKLSQAFDTASAVP